MAKVKVDWLQLAVEVIRLVLAAVAGGVAGGAVM